MLLFLNVPMVASLAPKTNQFLINFPPDFIELLLTNFKNILQTDRQAQKKNKQTNSTNASFFAAAVEKTRVFIFSASIRQRQQRIKVI